MMKKLWKNLRLVFLYFRINLSSALAYRTSFVMQAGGMLISNATFVFFWWIAFDVFNGRIGGYTFTDVMFVWALTSAAFGIASVFFGNMGSISRTIISGELDIYLLQPKPTLIGLLCNRSSLSGWGDLIYGLALLALTQGGDIRAWLVFVPSAVTGALLIGAVALTAHTLTFFFGDASPVGGMVIEFLINFSLYPMGIFPTFIQVLMRSLIPAALVVHLPLELARQFSFGTLAFMAGGVVLYCVVACCFFRYGLRRYESGNLIVTRL